ncbi:MAG TPA: M23 family metallopeptidase [Rhizomicrobium sp.]|jgi:murein DD-endopeptidase MepM/ murein hydrolase activator NlpD
MGQTRKISLLALGALMLPLVAGCMPETPRTQLEWGVNDRTHSRLAAAPPSRASTYTYQDNAERPAPRPAPNYVAKDAAPYAKVSSQPLAPVGGGDAPAFAWPVSGRVISDFGSTDNGGKNDGINIAAAMNVPIHASASGTVTYAGDELKGYGNLVLVKHSGGYTTAYAHADKLVVNRGDFVAKGQVIGYVGKTGDVTSPQLHFEIRSNTTPVNPRSYLASTTAALN